MQSEKYGDLIATKFSLICFFDEKIKAETYEEVFVAAKANGVDLRISKIDISKNKELATALSINSLLAFRFYKEGRLVHSFSADSDGEINEKEIICLVNIIKSQ